VNKPTLNAYLSQTGTVVPNHGATEYWGAVLGMPPVTTLNMSNPVKTVRVSQNKKSLIYTELD
jgi:hypothetical protein